MPPRPISENPKTVVEPFLVCSNTEACCRLPLHEVVYLACCNSSCELVTRQGLRYVSSKGLGYYEEVLQPYGFIRIHQSYLININHLCRYCKNEIKTVLLSNGDKLPVARTKQAGLLQTIKQWSVEYDGQAGINLRALNPPLTRKNRR